MDMRQMTRAPSKITADAIREALRSTDHEVPAQDILERSATYANGWRSLDEAVSSARSAPAAGFKVDPEVTVCLGEYKEALAELGRPDLTAARLRQMAGRAKERAKRHIAHAQDYLNATAKYLDRGSLVYAAQQGASARAAMIAMGREFDRAERLTARAGELALTMARAA